MIIYLPLLVIIFVGAIFIYKAQKVQWNESLLNTDEKVVYEQPKTTLTYVRAQNVERSMAWLYVKITNRRIFFLYPDKKAISTILDFTERKENTLTEALNRVTIYLDRTSLNLETDSVGHSILHMRGVNFLGHAIAYKFRVEDAKKVKDTLSL